MPETRPPEIIVCNAPAPKKCPSFSQSYCHSKESCDYKLKLTPETGCQCCPNQKEPTCFGYDCLHLFIPLDNVHQREKCLLRSDGRGGTCGPAAIAVLEGTTVQSVLERWKGIGESAFRNFSPIADMKETLNAFGYTFKYVRGGKAKTFPYPMTSAAIVRIQWLKDDGTEYYWAAAGAHTHYVAMQKIGDDWMVFCNGEGWFRAHGQFAKDYFVDRKGYVSSYLELTNEKKAKANLEG